MRRSFASERFDEMKLERQPVFIAPDGGILRRNLIRLVNQL